MALLTDKTAAFYITQKLHIKAGLVAENSWDGGLRKDPMQLVDKDQYVSKRIQGMDEHRD